MEKINGISKNLTYSNHLSFVTLNKIKNNNNTDVQTETHTDTFHHTYRWWYYINDVTIDNAPFYYDRGTHINNEERLNWENSMMDIVLNDIEYNKLSYPNKEGSFRKNKYTNLKPIIVKKNTLVIADTHGFHHRGITKNNGERIPVLGSSRLDQFIF